MQIQQLINAVTLLTQQTMVQQANTGRQPQAIIPFVPMNEDKVEKELCIQKFKKGGRIPWAKWWDDFRRQLGPASDNKLRINMLHWISKECWEPWYINWPQDKKQDPSALHQKLSFVLVDKTPYSEKVKKFQEFKQGELSVEEYTNMKIELYYGAREEDREPEDSPYFLSMYRSGFSPRLKLVVGRCPEKASYEDILRAAEVEERAIAFAAEDEVKEQPKRQFHREERRPYQNQTPKPAQEHKQEKKEKKPTKEFIPWSQMTSEDKQKLFAYWLSQEKEKKGAFGKCHNHKGETDVQEHLWKDCTKTKCKECEEPHHTLKCPKLKHLTQGKGQ
jgi:hypothetical protein